MPYKLFFEAADVAAALFDSKWKLIACNRSLRRLFGSGQHLMGESLAKIVGPAAATAAAKRVERGRRFEKCVELQRPTAPPVAVRLEVFGVGCRDGAALYAAIAHPIAAVEDADARRSLSLLQATLDSTADGLLIVDLAGKIVGSNRRFQKMWHVSAATLARGDDELALAEAIDQVRDPDRFLDRVRYLYDHRDERSLDTIELKDGRILERYSRPQQLGREIVGRVWSFRDVTEREQTERALRQSEERYRRLFEDSNHAIFVITHTGSIIEANPAALRLLGYGSSDVPSANMIDLFEDPAARAGFMGRMQALGSVEDQRVGLRTPDGRVLTCVISSTAVYNSAGEVIAYQGMIEDITDRVRAEAALRQNELQFRSLIENASDTITVLDQQGRITYESPSLERVLGYTPEMMIGHSVFEYVHDDDLPVVLDRFQRLLTTEGHTTDLEVRFRHGDGLWRTLDVVARNLLHDPAIQGIVVNARDVTERKAVEAQLRHDAFHDKLTQLPNRALLLDRMGHILRRSRREQRPFAVLFLDLDRFKVINDSLGHMIGDQLLIAMARQLEASSRAGDTVARLGGDEFTILLEGADLQEAHRVADRIHQDLAHPLTVGGHQLFATVSIGIVTNEAGHATAEEILRDADLAMYRAKDRGRARVEVFDASMRTDVVGKLEMETDLRRAIERNEFVMHFQPIVRLDSRSLYGFEALLRWHHPQRGLLMPAEFLALAEDTGLIVPVGWSVIEAVCRQLRDWSEAFGPAAVPVQVNMSAHQLIRTDFAARLQAVLEQYGTPAHLLVLELTESTMMENAESAVSALNELKGLGVGLSIDDFGTGYSSLSYLHRFPTDSVKIDRSFIAGMGPMARDSSVVRTIVSLAHDLDMKVIAEGIETEAQASTLRAMRCEAAQGFLFSRAIGEEEATRLLSAQSPW